MTHPLSRKVIFWPLIPQTLGHFTPYYIKTSDQTEISPSENSRQPKKHRLSKSGKWQFLSRGRIRLGQVAARISQNRSRLQFTVIYLGPLSPITSYRAFSLLTSILSSILAIVSQVFHIFQRKVPISRDARFPPILRCWYWHSSWLSG